MVNPNRTIWITSAACILLYLVILAWTLINIKKYLIDQKRYKTFSVLIFYVCAVIIELSRILGYVNLITIYATDSMSTGIWNQSYIYNFFYTVALFVKVILGFF